MCDEGLPPDIMHDILEGALPFTLKLMLRKFINEDKYFTLVTLNEAIYNFDYGYLEAADKPSPIQATTLYSSDKTKMGQSGMGMYIHVLKL